MGRGASGARGRETSGGAGRGDRLGSDRQRGDGGVPWRGLRDREAVRRTGPDRESERRGRPEGGYSAFRRFTQRTSPDLSRRCRYPIATSKRPPSPSPSGPSPATHGLPPPSALNRSAIPSPSP